MVTSKILRLKDLIAYIGLSRSVIYDRMNEGSERFDPTFPKSFPLGGKAIGWSQAEVDAWLERCADPNKSREFVSSAGPKVVTTPKSVTAQSPRISSRTSEPQEQHKTLGQMIVEGTQINDIIERYLSMATWTPAMGALLVSGVAPEGRCTEIPATARGLDNTILDKLNPRLQAAQKLLDLYMDEDNDKAQLNSEVTPLTFYVWCVESSIDTVWLRCFDNLARITKHDDALSSAALANVMRR
ncbi:hypothetical protein AEP_00672 [Curvibacter sp. AEP1-3]|uniref:helix-turn-helix transcriptional regulator n=1 Tax=Curvibacter sp. AEP1-3 TaxID=1844971 RepID=UPI000B3CAAC7|nr:AlpA family transcriptional regulator [Curvibacter sp. AEP1-3]ARV17632.1 hypothetical protein AEP_00672 [Curvibacter sp. AEP1-3]